MNNYLSLQHLRKAVESLVLKITDKFDFLNNKIDNLDLFSGDYNDLSNKPTLITQSDLSNKVDKHVSSTNSEYLSTYISNAGDSINLYIAESGRTQGQISVNSNRIDIKGSDIYITGVVTPTSGSMAANKDYVDNMIPSRSYFATCNGTYGNNLNQHALTFSDTFDLRNVSPGDVLYIKYTVDLYPSSSGNTALYKNNTLMGYFTTSTTGASSDSGLSAMPMRAGNTYSFICTKTSKAGFSYIIYWSPIGIQLNKEDVIHLGTVSAPNNSYNSANACIISAPALPAGLPRQNTIILLKFLVDYSSPGNNRLFFHVNRKITSTELPQVVIDLPSYIKANDIIAIYYTGNTTSFSGSDNTQYPAWAIWKNFSNETFIATYNSTTYNEVYQAMMSKKIIICKYSVNNTTIYASLVNWGNSEFRFCCPQNSSDSKYIFGLTSSGWRIISSGPYNAVTSVADIESGDYLLFSNANSLNRISKSNSLYFGTDTTKYLANNGTWQNIPTNISTFTNDAGYLTSYNETDPIFSTSPAANITSTDITNWNNKLDNIALADYIPKSATWNNTIDVIAHDSPGSQQGKVSYITSYGIYFQGNDGQNSYSYVGLLRNGKNILKLYGNSSYAANGVRLTNLATPTENSDAVNKLYVDTAIGNINGFEVAVVNSLPTENIDTHTFYFMSNSGSGNNIYDEYLYINNAWEKIGSTEIDLSGYLLSTDIADWAKASTKPSYTANEVGALSSDAPAAAITSTDITNWNAKVDSSTLSGYMQKSIDYVTAGQKSGTTLGTRATAEGYEVVASGYYSHAEGADNVVSGNHSHVEGRHNTVDGFMSHAEGIYNTVSGYQSHAEGEYTIANHKNQHVFGRYNIADTNIASAMNPGDYVEIVGNGTANDARSNARTLDWSGNEVLAGKLTVGAGPTNNMDVATKQYVDSVIPTVPTNVSAFTNDAGYLTSAPVTSVNGQTGAVTITDSDEKLKTITLSNSSTQYYPLVGEANQTASTKYYSTNFRVREWNNNFELQIGQNSSNPTSGSIKLVSNQANAWVTLKTQATTDRVILFPDAAGTIALTSDIPTVPTNVSAFTNDAGYLTSYTETDPTVPAWAKAASKPTYTASEVGAATSIHQHGNIANNGTITTYGSITSGARLLYASANTWEVTMVPSEIAFGTSETTYLTNKGTWKTPDYPVTSVNSKTGAVSLTASDVGALPDTTDVTKWNGVSLAKTSFTQSETTLVYVPYLVGTTSTGANLMPASFSSTPTAGHIARYNTSGYLSSTTPSANDNSTKVATTAYVDAAVSNVDALPSQNDNSGKFLTTNGTTASWTTITDSDEKLKTTVINSGNNTECLLTGTATDTAETKHYASYLKYGQTNNSAGLLVGNTNVKGQLFLYSTNYYRVILTPPTLSANRTITLPDKDGTVALTSDIPTRYNALTNITGYLTIADLPVYNGGVE